MAKINWSSASRSKFADRIVEKRRARRATDAQIEAFILWRKSNPDVPDGDWYADFGGFIIVGTGSHPDSILEQGMLPWGLCVYPPQGVVVSALMGPE